MKGTQYGVRALLALMTVSAAVAASYGWRPGILIAAALIVVLSIFITILRVEAKPAAIVLLLLLYLGFIIMGVWAGVIR